MGLKADLDGEVEVEDSYTIDKIVGFGATSICYKTTKTTMGMDKINPLESSLPIRKEEVAIKKVKKIFDCPL